MEAAHSDPSTPRYRVEHHDADTVHTLDVHLDILPHHSSLDPYLSGLLRQGASGQLLLVDERSGNVVARRVVAPYRAKARGRLLGNSKRDDHLAGT